ncbi:WD40-repeat-containing domain protein [Suillus variegatus]|nr:WD40-repeat-containing domain protein [Suillus variegatus]
MNWFNPSTTPIRAFEDHYQAVPLAVAVLPDRQRMVTASSDSWLRMWDLRSGTLLKMMAGHKSEVWALAVSRDGQLIASGDEKGEVIAWHGATGEFLIKAIKSQFGMISMDFSPCGTVLATVSMDQKAKLWDTKTWQLQGRPITCYDRVFCVRYSPSGERLAIATASIIEIYHPGTRHRVAKFSSHGSYNCSLTWTPDGTGLLSSGNYEDPTIREWDASTWEQVGDAWVGHTNDVNVIAIHPVGTLVASASDDKQVRLWRLSDGHTISIFQHSDRVCCVTFSVDGEHILSGGDDEKISEWAVPKDALSKDAPKSKILTITTSACDALLMGGLSTAEEIVTQEITDNPRDYTSYATRSIVMARKLNWDDALQDANKSLRINPSLTCYVAKGIALCGKRQFRDATKVFDLAFTSTDGNSTTHLLFLIKACFSFIAHSALHYESQAITLFNANKHDEAMLRVQELVTDFPDTDLLACRVVETYLHVQLGTIALSSWCHKGQAVNHFTSAVSASALFSKSSIHRMYGDFTVVRWCHTAINVFSCSIAFFSGSSSGGTLSHYGSPPASNYATH